MATEIEKFRIHIGIDAEQITCQAAAQHINSSPDLAAPTYRDSQVATRYMLSHRLSKEMQMVDGVGARAVAPWLIAKAMEMVVTVMAPWRVVMG